VIEVNKRILRSEFAAQFLSSNDFSGMFQKRGQHLKRLFLEFYFLPRVAEFAGLWIKLEPAEADN
jgi:hypothetical protein